MTVLFSLQLSKHVKGFGKPCVRPIPAVLSGVYDEIGGDILYPDKSAMRDAMPHYWRKAFDRASIWTGKNARLLASHPTGQIAQGQMPYMTLTDSRGRYLNTVYAIPFRFEPTA